jgi:glycine dehydrogenase subunit 1
MAMRATRRHGRVVVAASVHPEYRQILKTYLAALDTELVTVETPRGTIDIDALTAAVNADTACVLIQHPNFFGALEDAAAVAEVAHHAGALLVAAFDPISLGLIKRPGDFGVDIVVAEGQCLGTPMLYGGPYLGVMACKEAFVRRLPGRIAGQTVDRRGKRCWVLTLQTREQHIRREKATSNICTNQGLNMLAATIYLATTGPAGLRQIAEVSARNAHYAFDRLAELDGVRPLYPDSPFFREFAVATDEDSRAILERGLENGVLAGVSLARFPELGAPDGLLIACTEKQTRADIDLLIRVIEG